MLNLNTIRPGIWIYSAPGDKGQIVYFPKMHCFFGPRNFRGPKIFHPPWPLDYSTCQKCPKDTYSHVGHLSRCIPCPRLHITAGEGSTSRLDCALPWTCPFGECYMDSSGICQACKPGEYGCDNWESLCFKSVISIDTTINQNICPSTEGGIVVIALLFKPFHYDRGVDDYLNWSKNITDILMLLKYIDGNYYKGVYITHIIPCNNRTKVVLYTPYDPNNITEGQLPESWSMDYECPQRVIKNISFVIETPFIAAYRRFNAGQNDSLLQAYKNQHLNHTQKEALLIYYNLLSILNAAMNNFNFFRTFTIEKVESCNKKVKINLAAIFENQTDVDVLEKFRKKFSQLDFNRLLPWNVTMDCNPRMSEMYPIFGPKSGGTFLTIHGRNFDDLDKALQIQIGDEPCYSLERKDTTIICVTSATHIENSTHNVFLRWHEKSYRTNFTFTYRPDPMVNTLQPLESIVSGGILLTTVGTYLDSVREPQMVVTVVTPEGANSYYQVIINKQWCTLKQNQNDRSFTN